jgi:hypothetical protein
MSAFAVGHTVHFSTETAHDSLVYKMERALEDGLITLGAFLDIKSVFDITTFFVHVQGI